MVAGFCAMRPDPLAAMVNVRLSACGPSTGVSPLAIVSMQFSRSTVPVSVQVPAYVAPPVAPLDPPPEDPLLELDALVHCERQLASMQDKSAFAAELFAP
jgi:hypothetical protein